LTGQRGTGGGQCLPGACGYWGALQEGPPRKETTGNDEVGGSWGRECLPGRWRTTEGKKTNAAISEGTRAVGSTDLSREGPGLCRVEGSWVDLDGIS